MGSYIQNCCRLPNDQNTNNGLPEDKHEITNFKSKAQIKPKKNFSYYQSPGPSRQPNQSSTSFGSPISQKSNTIISSQNKPLIFIDNDISVAVNLLTGINIYEKLLTGEILLKLISPLNDFLLSNVYEVLKSLYELTKTLIIKDENKELHKKVIELLGNAIGNDILDFSDIKEGNIMCDMKNVILDVICNLVEIYHFFKFTIAGRKEPYNIFLWNNVNDIEDYIEELSRNAQKGIETIRNSVLIKDTNNVNNSGFTIL